MGPLKRASLASRDLCRKAEALACLAELPTSLPSPHLLTLTRWAAWRELPPPSWTDHSLHPQDLGCGIANDRNQVCLLALSLGRWREPQFWPPWSLGAASLGGSAPRCLSHLAGLVLFLPPPSALPLFVPLLLACSLKLACGTQGQTDYSFSSMNVPFN